MESFEEDGKSVGIVLDLSLRHHGGRRIIDSVKKQLIKIAIELFEDDVDTMYLYHPSLVDSLSLHGEQVSAIGNYDSDGWKLNLHYALRHTLYVLMAEDMTYRKYVIFVTDRLTDQRPLMKAVKISRKELLDAHFLLIGIGSHYNRDAMESVAMEPEVTYIHLDDPSGITTSIFKEHDGYESKGV